MERHQEIPFLAAKLLGALWSNVPQVLILCSLHRVSRPPGATGYTDPSVRRVTVTATSPLLSDFTEEYVFCKAAIARQKRARSSRINHRTDLLTRSGRCMIVGLESSPSLKVHSFSLQHMSSCPYENLTTLETWSCPITYVISPGPPVITADTSSFTGTIPTSYRHWTPVQSRANW
ncbi:hypothetical protein J6590_038813 [Homalodisca vitripennis]|nr:hypothetical protein J6590_038813 [Homalodisca vitripennis]